MPAAEKLSYIRFAFIPVIFLFMISACSTVGDKNYTGGDAALPVMENIALNARMCWFRSGSNKFENYRLAPELQSFSDRPRILIVPKHNPNERPLLVIEATGKPANITVYGPLMQTRLSVQIDKDVMNWSKGERNCS